jgi:N-acetylmuramidase
MTQTINTADVIAWVESKGDQHAFRFEPGVYAGLATTNGTESAILNVIASIHNCSASTARVLYSSSFGLYQIMGFNLYGGKNPIKTTVFEYMNDAVAQVQQFSNFIEQKGLIVTPETLAESAQVRLHFGAVYNGNGQAYSNAIAQALKHFGYNVAG